VTYCCRFPQLEYMYLLLIRTHPLDTTVAHIRWILLSHTSVGYYCRIYPLDSRLGHSGVSFAVRFHWRVSEQERKQEEVGSGAQQQVTSVCVVQCVSTVYTRHDSHTVLTHYTNTLYSHTILTHHTPQMGSDDPLRRQAAPHRPLRH
jgi:hypothetical protein